MEQLRRIPEIRIPDILAISAGVGGMLHVFPVCVVCVSGGGHARVGALRAHACGASA